MRAQPPAGRVTALSAILDHNSLCVAGKRIDGIHQDHVTRLSHDPKTIREAADLREGDMIAFEIEGNRLVMRKVVPGRDEYLHGLGEVMGEWLSPEDEDAWRDL